MEGFSQPSRRPAVVTESASLPCDRVRAWRDWSPREKASSHALAPRPLLSAAVPLLAAAPGTSSRRPPADADQPSDEP
jgi:hypothetical protein